MVEAATLLYPSGSGAFSRSINSYEPYSIESIDDFNYREYEFNGSIMGEINIDNINVNGSDILIAYVNGECRGYTSSMLFPLTNKYIFPLMIYSSNTGEEKVTFKYYNGALDQLFDLRESIDFQSDMIVGNGLNTFELNGGNVELVEGLNINAAFPNPFNPVTNIEYTLSQAENVEITVYDIMGRKVETIYNGFKSNGAHSITWDASNKSSGIYYIQIKSNNTIKTEKVVLMK